MVDVIATNPGTSTPTSGSNRGISELYSNETFPVPTAKGSLTTTVIVELSVVNAGDVKVTFVPVNVQSDGDTYNVPSTSIETIASVVPISYTCCEVTDEIGLSARMNETVKLSTV